MSDANTLTVPGCGIAQNRAQAAAPKESTAPRASTGLGPNRSVSVPEMGAPIPDARPSAITV